MVKACEREGVSRESKDEPHLRYSRRDRGSRTAYCECADRLMTAFPTTSATKSAWNQAQGDKAASSGAMPLDPCTSDGRFES
jgi:hypothetical protein